MGRRVTVTSVKRREIDEDKLALAFLLLAKYLHERGAGATEVPADDAPTATQGEAAA